MAKIQLSQGDDLSVTQLDRSYLGEEKEVLSISGEDGSFVVRDLQGNNALAIDLEDGSVSMGNLAVSASGAVSITGATISVAVYSNATRPLATSVAAGTSIFNTDDKSPNWSDGTNWRDANGNLT